MVRHACQGSPSWQLYALEAPKEVLAVFTVMQHDVWYSEVCGAETAQWGAHQCLTQ